MPPPNPIARYALFVRRIAALTLDGEHGFTQTGEDAIDTLHALIGEARALRGVKIGGLTIVDTPTDALTLDLDAGTIERGETMDARVQTLFYTIDDGEKAHATLIQLYGTLVKEQRGQGWSTEKSRDWLDTYPLGFKLSAALQRDIITWATPPQEEG
jgi:hypothetical protein